MKDSQFICAQAYFTFFIIEKVKIIFKQEKISQCYAMLCYAMLVNMLVLKLTCKISIQKF